MRYRDKRVVVAGCSSGIGLATVEALVAEGAEVHGAGTNRPAGAIAGFVPLDLRDPRSIDSAVAQIGGEIDALFTCSGLPQTFPALDVMKVNFIGVRHWTEAWASRMRPGGAIATVTSTVGAHWADRLDLSRELVETEGFEAAMRWCERNPDPVADSYRFSKEVANVWTQHASGDLIRRGVRLNALLPGPVETPMMRHFEQMAPRAIIEVFTQPIGRRSRPEDQAAPLLFLNSADAGMMVGHLLFVDGGFQAAVNVGLIDPASATAAAVIQDQSPPIGSQPST